MHHELAEDSVSASRLSRKTLTLLVLQHFSANLLAKLLAKTQTKAQQSVYGRKRAAFLAKSEHTGGATCVWLMTLIPRITLIGEWAAKFSPRNRPQFSLHRSCSSAFPG